MPLYEYRCGKCGHLMELFVKNDREAPKECVKCGAPGPVKQFSSFATFAAAEPAACGAKNIGCGGCGSGGGCPYSGFDD